MLSSPAPPALIVHRFVDLVLKVRAYRRMAGQFHRMVRLFIQLHAIHNPALGRRTPYCIHIPRIGMPVEGFYGRKRATIAKIEVCVKIVVKTFYTGTGQITVSQTSQLSVLGPQRIYRSLSSLGRTHKQIRSSVLATIPVYTKLRPGSWVARTRFHAIREPEHRIPQ